MNWFRLTFRILGTVLWQNSSTKYFNIKIQKQNYLNQQINNLTHRHNKIKQYFMFPNVPNFYYVLNEIFIYAILCCIKFHRVLSFHLYF